MKYLKPNSHQIYQNFNTEFNHLNPKDIQEPDSGNSQNKSHSSKSFRHKKANSLHLPNYLPTNLPSQKIDNIITIWGSNNDPTNDDDENLTSFFHTKNNAVGQKFIEPSSVKIPKRFLFKSTMSIQTKSQSVQVYERQSNDFLYILDEKIKEISSLIKKEPNAYGLNTIKFNLSIIISLMETMKSNPNIDPIRLENVKNMFIDLLKEFQKKFEKIEESQSLLTTFQRIFKCLEAYISQHQGDDIILRVGSQEDLSKIEEKNTPRKKNSFSNPIIEKNPEFEWRTKLMKNGKYGNLSVQTKNLEEFRYIGNKKKIIAQEQQIVQRTLVDFLEDHIEIISTILCVLIIMLISTIFIFTN